MRFFQNEFSVQVAVHVSIVDRESNMYATHTENAFREEELILMFLIVAQAKSGFSVQIYAERDSGNVDVVIVADDSTTLVIADVCVGFDQCFVGERNGFKRLCQRVAFGFCFKRETRAFFGQIFAGGTVVLPIITRTEEIRAQNIRVVQSKRVLRVRGDRLGATDTVKQGKRINRSFEILRVAGTVISAEQEPVANCRDRAWHRLFFDENAVDVQAAGAVLFGYRDGDMLCRAAADIGIKINVVDLALALFKVKSYPSVVVDFKIHGVEIGFVISEDNAAATRIGTRQFDRRLDRYGRSGQKAGDLNLIARRKSHSFKAFHVGKSGRNGSDGQIFSDRCGQGLSNAQKSFTIVKPANEKLFA